MARVAFVGEERQADRPGASRRHSLRLDARVIRLTVSTSSNGSSRSFNLTARAWRMRRSLVVSFSLTTMWV
jgi:hypothetical protein